MSKTKKVLLVILLFVIAAAAFTACQPKDKVTLKSITLSQGASNVEVSAFSLTDIKFQVTDSKDNVFEITAAPSMLSETDLAALKTAGEHTVKFTYEGLSINVQIVLLPDETTPSTGDTVTVSFNANDGTAVKSVSGEKTVTVQDEPKTEKAGKTFGGWYYDQEFTNKASFPLSNVTRNTTLYAQWLPLQVTLTFEGGAADVSNIMQPVSIDAGTSLSKTSVQISTPKRDGYKFKGWYNGSEKWEKTTVMNASATLTAAWEANVYKIYYKLVGGTAEGVSTTVTKEVAYASQIVPIENPVKKGFTFMGWYDQDNYTKADGVAYSFGAMPLVESGLTLTAKWQVKDYASFLTYTADPDGKLIITGLNTQEYPAAKTVSHLNIPNEINGVKVKAIAANAFKDLGNLISVRIADGILSIGSNAFKGCKSILPELSKLPEKLDEIGSNALGENWVYPTISDDFSVVFAGADSAGNLQYILVKYIGASEIVTVPEGIIAIAPRAFESTNTVTLKEISLPASLVKISEYAFNGCTSLRSVSVADNSALSYIDKNAFNDTALLSNASQNGDAVIIGSVLFKYYGGTSYTVPASVKYLSDNLFSSSALKDLSFEDELNIMGVGSDVFTSEQAKRYAGSKQKYLEINNIFVKYLGNESLFVMPDNITQIAGYAFKSTNPNNIVIGANVSQINAFAFSGLSNIKITFMGGDAPAHTDEKAFYRTSDVGYDFISGLKIYLKNEAAFSEHSEWTLLKPYFYQLKAASLQISDNTISTAYNLGDTFKYLPTGFKVITTDGITRGGDENLDIDFSAFDASTTQKVAILADWTQYYVLSGGAYISFDESKPSHRALPRYYKAFAATADYDSVYFEIDGAKYILTDGGFSEYDGTDRSAYSGAVVYIPEENGLFVLQNGNMVEFDRDDEQQLLLPKYAYAYVKTFNLSVSYPRGTEPQLIPVVYTVAPKVSNVAVTGLSKNFYINNAIDYSAAYITVTLNLGDGNEIFDIPFVKYVKEVNASLLQQNASAERFVSTADGYVLYDAENAEHQGKTLYVRVSNVYDKTSNPTGKIYVSQLSTANIGYNQTAKIGYDGKSEIQFKYDVTEPTVVQIAINDLIVDESGNTVQNGNGTLYGIDSELNGNFYITLIYENNTRRDIKLSSDGVSVENFDTTNTGSGKVMTIRYDGLEATFVYNVTGYSDQRLFNFNLNLNNKTATVTGINAESTVTMTERLFIPAEITVDEVTYAVTAIADEAFKGLTEVTFVNIPASLEVLGVSAFAQSSVKEVYFAANSKITQIAERTFENSALSVIDFNGASILTIGQMAFQNTRLAKIVLPDSVVTIGDWAFADNGSLAQFTVSNVSSLTEIKALAFENDTALTSIYLPEKLTAIGNAAFKNTGLSIVTIPAGVTVIADSLFEKSANLRSVEIPAAVREIGKDAFRGCSGLLQIKFGDYVRDNNGGFVFDVTSNSYVTFDSAVHNGVQRYSRSWVENKLSGQYIFISAENRYDIYDSSVHGVNKLATRYSQAFVQDDDGEYFNMADGQKVLIASLTHYSVSYVENTEGEYVRNPETPDKVTYIAYNADAHQGLTRYSVVWVESTDGIYVYNGEEYLDVNFKNNHYKLVYTVDDNGAYVLKEGAAADDYTNGYEEYNPEVHDVLLPRYDVVYTADDNGKFVKSGDSYIEYVPALHGKRNRYSASQSLLSVIGDRAFMGCSLLATANFESEITKVGESAFRDCAALDAFPFAEGLITIGDNAFNGAGINRIFVPGTVVSIGVNAFVNCARAESVSILSFYITAIEDNMFTGAKKLKYVYLTDNILTIGARAFYGCGVLKGFSGDTDKLTYGSLPAGLISIGDSAFENCSALSVDYLGINNHTRLTSVGDKAFKSTGLTSVVLPATLETLGAQAFDGVSTLTSLDLSAATKLKVISDEAFRGTAVASLAIPANIEKVGVSAFEDNTALTSVVIAENNALASIGERAFLNNISLATLTIGTAARDSSATSGFVTVLKIGISAFEGCTALTALFLPNSVSVVEDRSFYGCTSLKTLSIGVLVGTQVWVDNPAYASDSTAQKYITKTANVNYLTSASILEWLDIDAFVETTLTDVYTNQISNIPTLTYAAFGDMISANKIIFHVPNVQNAVDRIISKWGVSSSMIQRDILDYTAEPPTYYLTKPAD